MKLHFIRMSLFSILANRILPDVSFCERPRADLARAILGAKIGRGVRLRTNIDFGNDPTGITIGDGCYINRRCTLFADWGCAITLGTNVWLGPEVMLWTGSHTVGPGSQRCGTGVSSPIVIGNGCWVGARATILGGVTIGSGSVVGASALVMKDIARNCLVAGVPAKLIRTLPPEMRELETSPC